MDVNLRGVFLCMKRAIGEMLGQEPIGEVRGRVINISSQHGMIGPPGHVAYAASKGGVINLTHQAAVDYAPPGDARQRRRAREDPHRRRRSRRTTR